MTWRLSELAPDLAERIASEEPRTLDAIAALMVGLAEGSAGFSDPETAAARVCLVDGGPFGDTDARAVAEDVANRLEVGLPGVFDLVESGAIEEMEYLHAYERARAAAALFHALDDDRVAAAMEATFEACGASDVDVVRNVLSALDSEAAREASSIRCRAGSTSRAAGTKPNEAVRRAGRSLLTP